MNESREKETSKQKDIVDFSSIFKIEAVLTDTQVCKYSFCEIGLKKIIAVASKVDITFCYINAQLERSTRNYDWDFEEHPVRNICFEPSGTWLLILSSFHIHIVPFLPYFASEDTFDQKWSLCETTTIPLNIPTVIESASIAWWLTKEAEHVIIIGQKNGVILFFSLEHKSIVGQSSVLGEITDLKICVDDCLDQIVLVVTGLQNRYWKLILEHRSIEYNWLKASQVTQIDTKEKKDSFIAYIRQLSTDKITLFTQKKGATSSESEQTTTDYSLNPVPYSIKDFDETSYADVPTDDSSFAANRWIIEPQYADGRHFMSGFHVKDGSFILQSMEEQTPSHVLRPRIEEGKRYRKALWSQRIVYVLTEDAVEIHSTKLSIKQEDSRTRTDKNTLLWKVDLRSPILNSWLLAPKAPQVSSPGWQEPTFVCDLQLPRFALESCLVVTANAVHLVTTSGDICEWLVGLIMKGGGGVESAASALAAPLRTLLTAAADMLLSRNQVVPAQYLYSLSQGEADGWLARLAVFGRLKELAEYEPPQNNAASGGNTANLIRLLCQLVKVVETPDADIAVNSFSPNLSTVELAECASLCAALGLWKLLPRFTLERGMPALTVKALKIRSQLCRGSLYALIRDRNIVPVLLEDDSAFILDYIESHFRMFDTKLLMLICIWMCPLQEQLRPILRDLKQGRRLHGHTATLHRIVTTFAKLVSEVDARRPRSTISAYTKPKFVSRCGWLNKGRVVACGMAHWAVANRGVARIMLVAVPVRPEIVGRVVDVACGRHHTVVLTENGVYTAGDNAYGQLGVGRMWYGALGDEAPVSGALLHVKNAWLAQVVTVAAGHYHSAAVDIEGNLYMWGWGVHGQLGLGSIVDYPSPQLVTALKHGKVTAVGCGACHTAVLLESNEVWAFGANVFGQLGNGGKDKSSVPVKVSLIPDPVELIAVGYFHNLALTSKGELWVWGSSPQSLRASAMNARRHAASEQPVETATLSTGALVDQHLVPASITLENVQGRVSQISAGWHHSCLLDTTGTVYTWGLNFDGQLGSKDRKEITQPTPVNFTPQTPSDLLAQPAGAALQVRGFRAPVRRARKVDSLNQARDMGSKAVVACGSDYTVFVDHDGKVFLTGNTHQKNATGGAKSRMIMMKTTRRVIRIPNKQTNHNHQFNAVDHLDIILNGNSESCDREAIVNYKNPLNFLKDFGQPDWLDEILVELKPWITENVVNENLNVRAKLSFFNESYADCLKFQLDHLQSKAKPHPELFCVHKNYTVTSDDIIMLAKETVLKRIKAIGLCILNEQPIQPFDAESLKKLPCFCKDDDYMKEKCDFVNINNDENGFKLDVKAAKLLESALYGLPASSENWQKYLDIAKLYFVKNNLPTGEFETVAGLFLREDPAMMASAVILSDKCYEYEKVFSPKLFLNVCNKIFDNWC